MDSSYVCGNKMSSGGCLPLPQCYIHVYDHNVQLSSLKTLNALKPNFIKSIDRKGE